MCLRDEPVVPDEDDSQPAAGADKGLDTPGVAVDVNREEGFRGQAHEPGFLFHSCHGIEGNEK